ncbi:16533_t:CDS:2, partial [Cetraspora pellucida]
MEYNIHSNDNEVNESILTSLKDLDNIFFVDNSDSESEKDDEKLAEELGEFVDISDDYIEDKIYDELKIEIKEFFLKQKCSCRSTKKPCFEQIGYDRFLKRRVEFESLDKKMRDIVIKGQLLAFQKEENTKRATSDSRQRWRYNYSYSNNIVICRDTYLALVGISHKSLENIIKHFREHGLKERVHGNTGRAPKNMNCIELSYDIACDVYQFLKNYSNIHVYNDYVRAYKDKHREDTRVMAESTFINIWKALIPSLQFMSPKSDLCETCEILKMDIQNAMQYEKKVALTENYIAHLNRAQKERDYYNNNITTAVDDGKRNPNLNKIEDEYKNITIRSFVFDANTLPSIISTRPLSLKRQEELYKEI